MTKGRGFWNKQVSGPERAFLAEVSSSSLGRDLMVPLIFSFVVISTGYLFPSQDHFGVSVHILDALTLPSSLVVYAVFKVFLSKSNNLWSNVAFSLASGSLSVLSANFFLFALTGRLSNILLAQLPIGLIAYSLLTAITSMISAGVRLSRARLRSLRQQRTVLEEIGKELESQINTMRGEIRRSVQSELTRALIVLEQTRNPKELSKTLLTAIDEVIRPLSHRLAGFGVPDTLPRGTEKKLASEQNLRGVSIARLAAPELYALLFTVFILPATFFTDGASGLVSALILLFALTMAFAWIERRGQGLVTSRFVGMLLLAGFSGAIGSIYLLVPGQSKNFGITVGFVTTSLGVTGLMALVSKRLDDLRALAVVNQDMRAVVSVLRQEAWVTKTRLAKAIHGSVQAKFLAVALRIGAKETLSESDLFEARKDIESSIAEVERSVSGNADSFEVQFKTIEDAWDGAARLTLKADRETIARLDSHPVARICVLEVIGEAVANAAKHSKAPAMEIELQESGSDQIVVSVWSAGNLSKQAGRKGYGSQLLDQVTSHWTLTNLKGRVYLRAVIQLAN